MALKLNGARLDLNGKEFTYDVPGFGVDFGPAFLKIVAKPAATVNTGFRKAVDEVMHGAKVCDKTRDIALAKTGDVNAEERQRAKDFVWVQNALAKLRVEHCIVSWSTDIVDADDNPLKITDENWVGLQNFEHHVIQNVFRKMQADLENFDNFSVKASNEVLEDEAKN